MDTWRVSRIMTRCGLGIYLYAAVLGTNGTDYSDREQDWNERRLAKSVETPVSEDL